MLHDGLMLNPERLRFSQDGAEFWHEPIDQEIFPRKRVFAARADVPEGDVKAAEEALKEFVIWCYDRRLTPVRAAP